MIARRGRRAGGVFLVADGDQFLGHLVAVAVKLVGDLVADAPEDDAGMVAVSPQHGPQVGVVPLVEIEVIAERRLAAGVLGKVEGPVPRPFVEGLIKYIHPHLIAQVVKLRRKRMMARADGVAAHLLETGDAICPHADGHGIAKRTRVLMQAHALEFGGLAVDQQPARGVVFQLADAEARRRFIQNAVRQRQRAAQAVELGRGLGPQARPGHLHLLRGRLTRVHAVQRDVRLGAGDHRVIRRQHAAAQHRLPRDRPRPPDVPPRPRNLRA